MTDLADFAARLRAIPVFSGTLPAFDVVVAPAEPIALFVEWLTAAIDAGIREPHAMSLATADASCAANVRVLILKGVGADGAWQFAGSSATAKGSELGAQPAAAAAFYWPALGRQIRLRGPVREASHEASAEDFLARSPGARAETLVARQGQALEDAAQIPIAIAAASDQIDRDPSLVAQAWTRWEIVANEIEFFQGDAERRHTRLGYTRTPDGWERIQRWP